MQFRKSTTVLKRYYILWLMVKGDFGMNSLIFTMLILLFQMCHIVIYHDCHVVVLLCNLLYGRVERIYREINNSIMEGSLVITLTLKKLPQVLQKLTALTGLLVYSLTICIRFHIV